jgi:acyl-CoA-binding protein
LQHHASIAASLFINDMDEELEAEFEAASQYVAVASRSIDQSHLLKFYGLYKQSTSGPCLTTKPPLWDPKGRAKWDAWKGLGSIQEAEAQQAYVELLTSIAPEWNAEGVEKQKGGVGPVMSHMKNAIGSTDGVRA